MNELSICVAAYRRKEMNSPSNVLELEPNDIDPRRGLSAPDLSEGILVIMISNPDLCRHCVEAEPEFHIAANMSRGLEMVKFATLHLNREEWSKLRTSRRRQLVESVCPGNNKIPDYSFIINGQPTEWKPIDRKASTLVSMVQQMVNDLINDTYLGNAVTRTPLHGGSWYDYNDDEDRDDDEEAFGSIMTNLDLDSVYGYNDDRLINAPTPGLAIPTYETAQCSTYGFCS